MKPGAIWSKYQCKLQFWHWVQYADLTVLLWTNVPKRPKTENKICIFKVYFFRTVATTFEIFCSSILVACCIVGHFGLQTGEEEGVHLSSETEIMTLPVSKADWGSVCGLGESLILTMAIPKTPVRVCLMVNFPACLSANKDDPRV